MTNKKPVQLVRTATGAAAELKHNALYLQTADVQNPAPDRRKTDDLLSAVTIPKGTVWRAVRRSSKDNSIKDEDRVFEWWELEAVYVRFSSLARMSEHSSPQAKTRGGDPKGPSLWELVLPTLEEKQPSTLTEVYEVGGWGGWGDPSGKVLKLMLDAGLLTLEQVAGIIAVFEQAERDTAWDKEADPVGEVAHEAAKKLAVERLKRERSAEPTAPAKWLHGPVDVLGDGRGVVVSINLEGRFKLVCCTAEGPGFGGKS